MTDDRELIERLRAALDKGARSIRPSAPPFGLVGSHDPDDESSERRPSWRVLTVAATAVAIAGAGIVALVSTTTDDGNTGGHVAATTAPGVLVERTGPGTIPSGPPDIDTVRFSTEPVRTGGMVLEDQGGPQLCTGLILESLPPQCGGAVITNWKWSAVRHTTNGTTGSATRWGSYRLVGTYNEAGTEFTLTEPVGSGSGRPGKALTRDSSTPCPEPPGGWDSPFLGDGSTPTSVPPNPPRVEGVDQLAGFGGTWFDRENGVRNVRIVGGTDAEDAARRWIAQRYDGPICVVPSRYTEAQLRAVQDQVSALHDRTRSSAMTSWGVLVDARLAVVYVTFGAPAPELEAALSEHYGDSIVFEHRFTYVDDDSSMTAVDTSAVPDNTDPGTTTTTPDTTVATPETDLVATDGFAVGTDLIRVTGMVLESPQHGPRLCSGGIHRMYPPDCGGALLTNWDWTDLATETDRGTGRRWSTFVVTGRYSADGTEFTLDRPVEPAPDATTREAEARRHRETQAMFSTPCPEPDGGWNSPYAGLPRTSQTPEIDGIKQIAGYGGSWFDRVTGVENVRVVGDETARAAAHAFVEQRHDGPVCIVPTGFTEAELRRMQDEILQRYWPRVGAGGGLIFGAGVPTNAQTASVSIGLAAPVPAYEDFMTSEFGDAVSFERHYELVDD